MSIERGGSILHAKVDGRVKPMYQESTWKEREETMSGPLLSWLESFDVLPLAIWRQMSSRNMLSDVVPKF